MYRKLELQIASASTSGQYIRRLGCTLRNSALYECAMLLTVVKWIALRN